MSKSLVKRSLDPRTEKPILVMIGKGRKGRGFIVAPADSMDEPVMCMDLEQVVETLNEWVNDPNRERFDPVEMEEEEFEEEEEAAKKKSSGGIFDFTGKMDPADELLFNIGNAVYEKAHSMSNGYRVRKKKSRRARRKSGGSSK